MSTTSSVILVICVLIITVINVLFLIVCIWWWVRARKVFSQVEKFMRVLDKISSKGAALLGTLLGAMISFLGVKKSRVEKGGEKRDG
ncbi:MAG: hypothetical protein QME68_06370 [Elusimicrobiota bacterium]|nr:hypothetical protein [Elusimicrobiota bacterium]